MHSNRWPQFHSHRKTTIYKCTIFTPQPKKLAPVQDATWGTASPDTQAGAEEQTQNSCYYKYAQSLFQGVPQSCKSKSDWRWRTKAADGWTISSHSDALLGWRHVAATVFICVLPLPPLSVCTLCRLCGKSTEDGHEHLSVRSVVCHPPAVHHLCALRGGHQGDYSGDGPVVELHAPDTVSVVGPHGSQVRLLWKSWSQNHWRSRSCSGHQDTGRCFQKRVQSGVLRTLWLHDGKRRDRLPEAEGPSKGDHREVPGACDQVVIQAHDGLPHGADICVSQRTVPHVSRCELEDPSRQRQVS